MSIDEDATQLSIAHDRLERATRELSESLSMVVSILARQVNAARTAEETAGHHERLNQIVDDLNRLAQEIVVEVAHYHSLGDA